MVNIYDGNGNIVYSFKDKEDEPMELTREEAIRNFREHWASNAITGVDKGHKGDYLERNGYHNILYNCFLCEFTRLGTSDKNCSKCPIEWPLTKFRGIAPCGNSYYGDWNSATTYEERKRLAAIIRDLPEKNEAKPALKIGDRVTALSIERKISGKTGTVKGFAADGDVRVEFDEHVGGHELQVYLVKGTEGKDGHCWWVKPQLLEKLEKPAPRFAVGDKVVPVSKSKGDSFETWSKYRKKDFVTVQQLPPNRHGDVYVCNGDFFLESDLRPYVEPPKFKFAVGDKVRAIAETNGWGEVKKGDTGTITHTPDTHPCKDEYEHYKDRYRVDFPAQKEWDGKEECFELFTEPEPPARKFKVSDRVRVRSWEEMLKEFGLDDDGDISIPGEPCFNRAMQYLCGRKFTVTKTAGIGVEGLDSGVWSITVSMLELLPINHCPENKTIEDTCVGTIDRFPRKFIFNGNKTTCIISLDGKWYKGTAKCAPSDKWDETLGAELAYARARIALWKDHERQLLGKG